MDKYNSKHWVLWKCHKCNKLHKTHHSNIPEECKCGCKHFKWIGRQKKSTWNKSHKRRPQKVYNNLAEQKLTQTKQNEQK